MYKLESQEQTDLSDKEIRKMLRKYLTPYQMNQRAELTAGRHHWKWFAGGKRKDFIERHLKGFVKRGHTTQEMANRILNHEPVGPQVDAIIVDGRWVARCECIGQEVVDPDDPVFVCLNPSCLNIMTDHKPRKVKFPNEKTQKAISEILLARPNPVNRNWLGETLEELEKENVEHGLEKRAKVMRIEDGMDHTNQ